MSFTNFQEFLNYIAISEIDCEFLKQDDADNIYITIYAMSNSGGGYIVIGADTEEITGVDFDFKLDLKKLRGLDNFEIQDFSGETRIILIKISPLDFYLKPAVFNSRVYRRVEGINLISGMSAVRYMAKKFDDGAINFKCMLNQNSVKEFHKAIISRDKSFEIFDRQEFLKRSLIFSGKYLTRAGFFILGENSVNVNMTLKSSNGKIVNLSARNLWIAYSDMLPRLISCLSNECASAVFEIFMNAFIHADYELSDTIDILITDNPLELKITNSGLPMTINNSYSRNFRLMKIFKLLKSAHGNNYGSLIIKKFSPDFKLEQDMLNFTSTAKIKLEGLKKLPSPVIL